MSDRDTSYVTMDQLMRMRDIDAEYKRRGEMGIGEAFKHFLDAVEPPPLPEDRRDTAVQRRHTEMLWGRSRESEAIRVEQALRLWELGWARTLGFADFSAYLETIPKLPVCPFLWSERFDRAILVDTRVPLGVVARLLGVICEAPDKAFLTIIDGPCRPDEDVYWMHCQDGSCYQGKDPAECWKRFSPDEKGLTAFEGLSLFAQDPRGPVISCQMNLIGTVYDHAGQRGLARLSLEGTPSGIPAPMLSVAGDKEIGSTYANPSRGCKECLHAPLRDKGHAAPASPR